MRLTMRLAIATFASLVICGLLAGPALAASADRLNSRDQIVLNGTLTVAEGQTVDTALLGHGIATIAGTVTGAVVVFDGRTDISGTVQGDVFVFNGTVTVRSSAVIDGDLVTRESPNVESGATIRGKQQRLSARFDAADIGFASRVAWWIGSLAWKPRGTPMESSGRASSRGAKSLLSSLAWGNKPRPERRAKPSSFIGRDG